MYSSNLKWYFLLSVLGFFWAEMNYIKHLYFQKIQCEVSSCCPCPATPITEYPPGSSSATEAVTCIWTVTWELTLSDEEVLRLTNVLVFIIVAFKTHWTLLKFCQYRECGKIRAGGFCHPPSFFFLQPQFLGFVIFFFFIENKKRGYFNGNKT